MSTRTKLIILLASAIALPAWAQESTPQAAAAEPAAPATPAATVQGAEPTAASSVSRDKDTLSVDFPDEDIKTILRNVADLFELNLVVPDTLTGKTSIKLRDVTWRQIFQVVLTPVGYTYIEEGNIIKIVSNETLQQEPASTEVFVLNNAKAVDIKPTIDGLIDAAAGGKIVIDARSNALVITERPSRMGRIRGIIEKLDKATDQVMIESKFVEVSDSDIRNIGVNWASLQNMRLGVSQIQQSWDRSRGQTTNGSTDTSSNSNNGATSQTSAGNAVTYVTAPNGISSSNGSFTNSTLNLPNGQVTGLPASVPATTRVSGFSVDPTTGVISYTAPVTYSGSDSVTTDSSATSAISNLMGLTNSGAQNRLASAVFSASDFNVVLSALKTQSNTKVVSNPTVVTLNNTEASINIGSEYPIPSYTYNSERGTFEVSGFQYKPIGVILKVTPQVNAQGTIRLNLEPEISSSNRQTSFGGAGGASIPIIDTRKVKTQVSLKDGFTAGIGGLITTQKNHGGSKVPVLGSIPLLGRLFSSTNVNDQTTNLLIFITAKTVNADGAAPEDIFNPTALDALGMSKDSVKK